LEPVVTINTEEVGARHQVLYRKQFLVQEEVLSNKTHRGLKTEENKISGT